MDIVICSQCGVRVLPKLDGSCPACRRDVTGINGEEPQSTVPDIAVVSHTQNDGQPIPTHFDVLWILFSVRGRLSLGMLWITSGLSITCWVGLFRLVYVASSIFPILQLTWVILPLVMFWNAVAIGSKRLHDIGWPGWLVLPGLIPVVGHTFLFFTIGMLKGNRGENRYGADPRRVWSAGMIDEQ